MNLSTLPTDHPLRNRPLAEIGARYREMVNNYKWSRWRIITPGYGIAAVSYNELADLWLRDTEWEAECSTDG